MSLRDDLRPASFRGVPFEVFSASRELGRKIDEHEFPGRDYVATEDFGRAARMFRFEAVIIGDDYKAKRDAFDAALETAGPGVLIHPWYGRKTVVLRVPASTEDSSDEGGMTRYSLEFVEAEEKTATVSEADKTADVVKASDSLKAVTDDGFLADFEVGGLPTFVKDGAGSIVGKMCDQFDGLTAGLKGAGDGLNGFIAQGLKLRTDALSLVLKPASLLASVSGMIRNIRLIAATPGDALNALKILMRFGSSLKPVVGSTPQRQAERVNQAALVSIVTHAAAAEAVQAVTEISFTAYQEAAAVRDDMAERLDDLATTAADTGNDAAYQALMNARATMIADVTARGGSLQRLYDYRPAVATSAIVLAYGLYEDASLIEDRVAEIVSRNDLKHPGFISADQTLEVLSDG